MNSLYNTQENVRELETECEELDDNYTEKFGEFIVAGIARKDGEEKLRLAREEEANIQKDIDFLLGI